MPRPKSKEKKSKLPSLEHRYQYRSARRDTDEGVVLEALGGDKEMIARLAQFGALLIVQDRQSSDGLDAFAPWLASILEEIGRGVSPNEAFGWEGNRDRWKLHGGETWARLEKAYQIGTLVEQFATDVAGKPYASAVSLAAGLWRAPADRCSKAMSSVASTKRKLSKTDAVELALDLVAEFGAGRHRVSRDSALGYYKELVTSRSND